MVAERCAQCGKKAKVMGRLSDCLEFDRIRARYQCPGIEKKTAVVCWCDRRRKFFEQGAGGRQPGTCEKCRPVQGELGLQVERLEG